MIRKGTQRNDGKIKEIVKTYNYYKDEYNYIIINNFEYLKLIDQNRLRVIIEKSFITTKFIIITTKYNKVIESIKSLT